jgi:cyclophilin family peptidyl-prolyl cis-trans isomerase/HEAT repeat protein
MVKRISFQLLSVGVLCLLFSCFSPNKFSNNQFIEVLDAADRRDTALMFQYLKHESEPIRLQAAISFGSFCDSACVDGLFSVLRNEPSVEVMSSLLFALGQTASVNAANKLLTLHEFENNDALKASYWKAMGKCGADNYFLRTATQYAREFGFTEGVFYLVRSGKSLHPDLIKMLVDCAAEDNEIGYFAAHALSRSSFDVSPFTNQLVEIIKSHSEQNIRCALILTLARSKTSNTQLEQLYQRFNDEYEYFSRLAVLRAFHKKKDTTALKLMGIALTDPHVYVREQAAMWLRDVAKGPSNQKVYKLFNAENDAHVRYLLAAYLLKSGDDKTRKAVTHRLRADYSKIRDEYVKGYIISALSEDFSNFGFIVNAFQKEVGVLGRQFAYEALLSIRKSPRFGSYSKLYSDSVLSLSAYFSQLITSAFNTGDVSLIAMSAQIVRDKELNGDAKLWSNDIDLLQKLLAKLKLPRDIEIYGELLQTMAYLQGKELIGSVKPEYNNPPDWGSLKQIKRNQEIRIYTDQGVIEAELWIDKAPTTVAYFMKNVANGFYTSKLVHRLVPGFVMQSGCPRGDGYGSGSGSIRSEFNDEVFSEGVIGMASAGPDTESTQWFVMQQDAPHLNGRYTSFGRVTDGLEIVQNARQGLRILKIQLE